TEMHLYDHVSPASLRGVAMAVSIMIKRMIKRQVRQNPRVWAVVREARSLMGSLRRSAEGLGRQISMCRPSRRVAAANSSADSRTQVAAITTATPTLPYGPATAMQPARFTANIAA